MKGFLQHVPHSPVQAIVNSAHARTAFETVVRELGETRPLHVSSLRGVQDWTGAGTIIFPGPGYLEASWRRQHFDPVGCSLVGITHTVSTRRVIHGLHNLMLEPVEPWDAIICTSRAVHSVVKRQMDLSAAFIKQRFGATHVPMPQLPIIPLGIHVEDFVHQPDARIAVRNRFDTPDDAVVVMTMGRLTVVEKANPVPLFMALEEIATATGKPVHLWMVGWAARDDEQALHEEGQRLCPSVVVKLIDGRSADIRRTIWSGADIFTLPVDNIQETFGLAPVEAMAAGLPVVMPDWNGFRDTVVHGETGFLIPTVMPPAGTAHGKHLARRFADGTDGYLQHLSVIQQQTQIDIRVYVAALSELILNAGLRRKMGQAGVRHVRAHFDWAVVIPQYLALAGELAAMRKDATPTTPGFPRGPINPIEVDPFDLYSGYPSHVAGPETVITHRRVIDAQTLAELDQINGRKLYRRKMMSDERVIAVSAWIAGQGIATLAKLTTETGVNVNIATATVLFLAKYDFVSLSMVRPN